MSKIVLIGGAGFIGTNLINYFLNNTENEIVLVDSNIDYIIDAFRNVSRIKIIISDYSSNTDFSKIVSKDDYVIHLASTNVPNSKGVSVYEQINNNLLPTINLLNACVENKIKKFVFVSSGGAVYGKKVCCPIKEDNELNPISAYGLQKAVIEKTIHLYSHLYKLEYNILRIANPYGPYQRPNSGLGVLTTIVHKTLNCESFDLYGDGSVKRDFIYISDVAKAVSNVMFSDYINEVFNIGSGRGVSVNELIGICESTLGKKINVIYHDGRLNDVPINFLNIEKYRTRFPEHKFIELEDGIKKTYNFMANNS